MPSCSFPVGGRLFLLARIFQGGRDLGLSIVRAGQGARRVLALQDTRSKDRHDTLPPGQCVCPHLQPLPWDVTKAW